MRKIFGFFLILVSCFAQESPAGSQARGMLKDVRSRALAEPFLDQAIAHNPDDADALSLLVLLKFGRLSNNAELQQTETAPLARRLLILRREGPRSPSDLALALELNAGILKQSALESQARLLSEEAFAIRKDRVHAIIPDQPADGIYKVGGGISAPSVVEKTDPEYSEAGRMVKLSGTVLLSVVIGPDGAAHNVTLVHGLGFGLDEQAAVSVAKWRFKPGMKEEPVSVRAQIEVNFRLL